MGTPNPDDIPLGNPDPTSEVGLGLARESEGVGDPWRAMLELQNQNMTQLIEAIKTQSSSSAVIALPDFDPDLPDSDAQAWSTTADICLSEKPLQGGTLIIALTKALKGSANVWLSQVSYAGMTWTDFKSLFLSRYAISETVAATLVNLHSSQPKEGESLAAYASRQVTSLTSKWNSLNVEHIAVSTVLAHVSKFDSRAYRLAFTTEVPTRHKLQQELSVLSHLKRKSQSSSDQQDSSQSKKVKPGAIVCHFCGIVGHKSTNCRKKAEKSNKPSGPTSSSHKATSKKIVCYRCGEAGHVAPRCPKATGRQPGGSSEDTGSRPTSSQPAVKRVEACDVRPTTGVLQQSGESFAFCYDSGAECSLITETCAEKLCGKRISCMVNIMGIGNSSIICSEQILSEVEIDGYHLEILFHVIPDAYISHSIMIGREIIKLGFAVNMTETSLTLSKVKLINTLVDQCSIPENFHDIDTDIPSEYKPQLIELLQKYSHAFAKGLPSTRVTSGELKIRLIDPHKTVHRRPYRLTPDERQLVRSKVNDLIDAQIVRPSCSPFASPILLIKKRDGSDRMCVDYRELNSNTVADRFPLPLIADQIARLCGANFYTCLDCTSGFHQIPIHPDSIEATAFVTPDGQFEYLAMPFGLRNAPSVFQRAVTNALGKLVYSYVIIYIDDIMVPSKDPCEGLHRLEEVLASLTKAGFSLNLSKCSFLKRKVEYLGYEITSGELRPNPRKIEALINLKSPKTIHQLRQFIGLASYFRKFVENFSKIMKPLFFLTTGKQTFKWTDEHENIRQKIISILTNEPVLMIYNPEYPIELHTDASADGYGAILFQKVDKKMHVVEYYSKRTTATESKYHSYELETLAVVNAVKHFHHYLQGHKFTVVTDCNSLKASRNKADLTPRVHRWWAFLQAYDFDIMYREGRFMNHVDFLSRNPLPESINKIEQKRVDITTLSNNWLLAEQQRDSEILAIVSNLKNNSLASDIAQSYELRSGTLYRKIQRNGQTRCLPIVPRAFRWSVINHIHETIMHLGWDKTLEKVYEHYWFDKMVRYVRKFVDNCITCKVSKSNSGKIQAELHPIPKVSIPWHTVHIDVTGKLSGKSDLKEYIIVLIDSFTKYVLLYHTNQIDAANCIKTLKSSVSLFGAPSRVIADQGRCFASKHFKDFCDSHNIALHLIATGASRANGQVERIMKTLKSMLTAVETSECSWQDAIENVQIALNCTVNRVTKSSPLELLIGRVARPLGLMTVDSDEMTVNLSRVREQAALGITKNAEYDKVRYDKSKAILKKFQVGDFVLIANEERNQTKLDPKFKGPYRILELLDGDRYLLKALNSNRIYKYAHDRVRKMPECPVTVSDDVNTDTDDDSSAADIV